MDAVVVNIMKTLCELISSFTDLRNQIGGQSDNAAAKIEAIKKQLDVASVGFTQKYQMLIDFLYYDMNIGSVEKILRDLAHQCVEKSIPIEDSAVSPETLRVCIESLRFHAINYIDCSSGERSIEAQVIVVRNLMLVFPFSPPIQQPGSVFSSIVQRHR